jgi:hypothetical protein
MGPIRVSRLVLAKATVRHYTGGRSAENMDATFSGECSGYTPQGGCTCSSLDCYTFQPGGCPTSL